MLGMTEGRIVHYVLPRTRCFKEPQHRPAIIVNAWGNGKYDDEVASAANLIVFLDGSNDGPMEPTEETGYRSIPEGHTMWVTSATYNADGAVGTWHWPEKVEPVQA